MPDPRLQRAQPSPGAGIRHSDIARKYGIGAALPAGVERVMTPHGFAASLFASEAFVVRAEVLSAGRSIGYGYNDSGDRLVLVQQGMLFVTIEDGTTRVVRQVYQGNYFQAPRGRRYGLASSGVDGVGLLVIETPDYEQGWTAIEPPVVSASLEAPVAAPPPAPTIIRDRSNDALTAQQAQEAAALQGRRRAPTSTTGGQQRRATEFDSIGLNPKPSGPPRED